MPEGPEIRRAADKLEKAIVGQPLRAVEFAFGRLKPFEDELAASQVSAIETRGKALLTHFANGLSIYSHNQLYGRWYVVKAGKPANTTRSLRLAVRGSKHDILLYSASDIDVLDEVGIATHPFLHKLGPDALSPALDVKHLASRLADGRFARRRLADLLLDQAFVAGIGNYLRSEILFDAGLLPTRRPGSLDDDQRTALAESILTITRRAYRLAGITNDPARAAALKAAGVSFGRRRHAVFERAGEDCYRCGGTIETANLNRRVFWCAGCQL
jgi:endonuclease-8